MHIQKKKRQLASTAVICLISLLLLEATARTGFALTFNTPFFRSERIMLHFYPDLDKVKDYQYDESSINLLVLGGSVVTHKVLDAKWNDEEVTSVFCNMESLLDKDRFNTVSLAMAGHNSLDSRIKYNYLKKHRFDAIFLYHGINDTRTNNISKSKFDKRYRHIEFYDDLAVVVRHPEMNITTLPFMMDWLVHSLATRRKEYIPKELFYGLLFFDEPEPFLMEGGDIKSGEVFRSNFEKIIEIAANKQEYVVLSTYAWFIPGNYTYAAFKQRKLDYDEQLWPVELYGLPDNVRSGLIRHNEIIRELHSKYSEYGFLDMEAALTKGKMHFNDVCHLNSAGCIKMAEALEVQLIARDLE